MKAIDHQDPCQRRTTLPCHSTLSLSKDLPMTSPSSYALLTLGQVTFPLSSSVALLAAILLSTRSQPRFNFPNDFKTGMIICLYYIIRYSFCSEVVNTLGGKKFRILCLTRSVQSCQRPALAGHTVECVQPLGQQPAYRDGKEPLHACHSMSHFTHLSYFQLPSSAVNSDRVLKTS